MKLVSSTFKIRDGLIEQCIYTIRVDLACRLCVNACGLDQTTNMNCGHWRLEWY